MDPPFPLGSGEEGIFNNLFPMIDEITEVARELNWKKWKRTKKPVDRQKLLTELTDIIQFWGNAVLAGGFSAEEVRDALRAKWEVNRQRIKEKY